MLDARRWDYCDNYGFTTLLFLVVMYEGVGGWFRSSILEEELTLVIVINVVFNFPDRTFMQSKLNDDCYCSETDAMEKIVMAIHCG
mmetsp:Transcript_28610/g.69503  ORF Transcript_28610/g.69503 Transcript_28610/m.69503 type:complete len:86 (+) Transcript_28610:78-335(+)